MFKNKQTQTVVITLDDETKQALARLDEDLVVLAQLNREVILSSQAILGTLTGEITAQTPVEVEEETAGKSKSHRRSSVGREGVLGVQAFKDEERDAEAARSDAERERIRSAPFTRRPRSEQVAWLRTILADGEWHNNTEIAKSWGTEARHVRYLKSAVGGRFREMWEDDELDRRDSRMPGIMYEYRLKGGKA